MLSEYLQPEKVYIACGYTDLRRGIDGLAGLVQERFRMDPYTDTLYLFCGRRPDRIVNGIIKVPRKSGEKSPGKDMVN